MLDKQMIVDFDIVHFNSLDQSKKVQTQKLYVDADNKELNFKGLTIPNNSKDFKNDFADKKQKEKLHQSQQKSVNKTH